MRNAVEHPGGHSGDLVIRNFRFEPDGALAGPDWRRDKEGKTEYGPVSIVDDMRVGVENLLILAEDILVIWAIDHAAFPGAMAVSVIPEGKRNPGCPIKYRMNLPLGSLPGLAPSPAAADHVHRRS